MNYFPGQGLAVGTAILGSTVGQAYPAGTVLTLCKIFGRLLTPDGKPVGSAGQELKTDSSGTKILPVWKGVSITASPLLAVDNAGAVITIDKVSATTNEQGYFEIFVIQGLTVSVTCSSFGKTVPVNTTGNTSIDISGYF